MKKFFKFIFKLIIVLLLTLFFAVVLNNETDLLSDFGKYSPQVEEKYPQFCDKLKFFSDYLHEKTGNWPTIERIAAIVESKRIRPEDIAVNSYIKDSPLISFYDKESVGFTVDNNTVTVFGNSDRDEKTNFIAVFSDENGKELSQTSFSKNFQNEFAKKIKIPDTDKKRIQLSLYYSPKLYGEYTSWILDYIFFECDNSGIWSIEKSPVYEDNCVLYETDKSITEAVKASVDILSDRDDMKKLVNNIINGIEGDYDKLIAIHDWICEYIYYDEDAVASGQYPSYNPVDVINNRRGVCKGFAYLFASMARSVDIPCNIVSGYALGVDGVTTWQEAGEIKVQNHAWNEAYADGRWIIIDSTWDCGNRIENGEKTEQGTSHAFFDANIDYFSANHKIMQYVKK